MAASLRPAIPCLQGGQRAERTAAVVPARLVPELEVEMAAPGVTGVAHRADRLAGVDAVALSEGGGLVEVHVDVVDLGPVAVDDEVVAGGGVVLLELNAAAARGHHASAARGHHVLALVDVSGAARAESRAGAAVVVAPADREDVVVEVEGVALDVARPGAARLRAVR